MMNFVSIQSAIDTFADRIGLTESREFPIFIEWGLEAEKRIGSYYSYRKSIAVINIENGEAKLPVGTIRLLGYKFGNSGYEPWTNFGNGYYINPTLPVLTNQFVVIDNSNNEMMMQHDFDIIDNTIIFRNPVSNTQLTVLVLHILIDAKCFPMILDYHKDAIAEYIAYRYALRSQYSKRPVPQNLIREHSEEWNRLAQDARAEDAKLNPDDRSDIIELINNPISGFGINNTAFYWQTLYM